MTIAQTMEDIWLSANLDDRWAHPLNEGWMNHFQRWTATPSFRTWWPILRPLYNPRFRDFVRERFRLVVSDPDGDARGFGALLQFRPFEVGRDDDGVTISHLRTVGRPPARWPDFVYELRLPRPPRTEHLAPVQVGIFTCRREEHLVTWNSDDLFVLPSLYGAGFTSRFLDAVITHFGAEHDLSVVLGADPASGPGHSLSRAARTELTHRITFYRSRDFESPVEVATAQQTTYRTRLIRRRTARPGAPIL